MKEITILELNNYCDKNSIRKFILESRSVSEPLGNTAKIKSTFSKILISAELGSLTLFDDYDNKITLMCVDRIEQLKDDNECNQVFNICCSIGDSLNIYKLYIELRNLNIHTCVCNKCKKEFDIWDTHNGLIINKIMGYGSRYDGEKINMNICCDCMDDIIESCLISPMS